MIRSRCIPNFLLPSHPSSPHPPRQGKNSHIHNHTKTDTLTSVEWTNVYVATYRNLLLRMFSERAFGVCKISHYVQFSIATIISEARILSKPEFSLLSFSQRKKAIRAVKSPEREFVYRPVENRSIIHEGFELLAPMLRCDHSLVKNNIFGDASSPSTSMYIFTNASSPIEQRKTR